MFWKAFSTTSHCIIVLKRITLHAGKNWRQHIFEVEASIYRLIRQCPHLRVSIHPCDPRARVELDRLPQLSSIFISRMNIWVSGHSNSRGLWPFRIPFRPWGRLDKLFVCIHRSILLRRLTTLASARRRYNIISLSLGYFHRMSIPETLSLEVLYLNDAFRLHREKRKLQDEYVCLTEHCA